KTIACLAGHRPDEPLGAGPVGLQKLTLGDPVLLLTALGALLNENGLTGRVLDRQGRRIVLLLAVFCGASVVSATLGETGSESLIELATYVWLRLSLVVIFQLLGSSELVRRILATLGGAGVVACVGGGVGSVYMLPGT